MTIQHQLLVCVGIVGVEDVKRLTGNEIHSHGAFLILLNWSDSWSAHKTT
jgi:hypothetical protein